MAIIYFNGFDHYASNGDLADEQEWYSDSLSVMDIDSNTRFGVGRSLRIMSTGLFRLDLGQEYSTLVVGFAYYTTNYYSSYSSPVMRFNDANTNEQIELFCAYNNGAWERRFCVARGDSGANILCVEPDIVWNINKWYYYELKIVVHDTTGSVELRRNGQTICSASGIDTKETSQTGIRYLDFLYQSSIDTGYDDLYVEDANFLGDVRIKTFYPDSDGTHTDFTRSTGSNDYECVDDSQPNDDTDYIESSTPGDKSTFGITTGSLSTVHGIRIKNVPRKTDAGAKQVRLLLRSNGVDYTGDTEDALDAYSNISKIYLTDPDDSNAWTQTKLEACEYGIEHVS